MSSLSVLVVDDNDSFRKDLVEYLAVQPDVNVIGEAKNGEEAVSLTASLDPDLVLMDFSMPVMDGLEATKQIKERGLRAKVVIVTIHDTISTGKRDHHHRCIPPERGSEARSSGSIVLTGESNINRRTQCYDGRLSSLL